MVWCCGFICEPDAFQQHTGTGQNDTPAAQDDTPAAQDDTPSAVQDDTAGNNPMLLTYNL